MKSRLISLYEEKIVPELLTRCKLKNKYQLPKLTKVVLSMGCSKSQDIKTAIDHLTKIAGQKAVATTARKSIAQFGIREGNEIGVKVTLRKNMMHHFIDRFLNVAVLRNRDFQRIETKALNLQSDNIAFSVGIRDIRMFPEVKIDDVRSTGCNITFCTNGKDKDLTIEVLKGMGFPIG